MKHRLTPTDKFLSDWPIATDNEAYLQFPLGWKTQQGLDWLKQHDIEKSRWGAYRSLKGTKRPLDFFVRVSALIGLLLLAGCTTTKSYVPNRDLAALHPSECYTNQTQGLEYIIGADLLQDLIIKAQGAK